MMRTNRHGDLVVTYLGLKSRIGDLWLAATPRGVFYLNLGPVEVDALKSFYVHLPGIVFLRGGKRVEHAAREVLLYLEGKLKRFSVKLDLRGSTAFSRRVWKATCKIPYGQVRSYAWVAGRVGDPNKARAVGGALSRNPVPILIPCHRVIGTHGDLCGFAGGLGLKSRLIALESGQSTLGLGLGETEQQ
jgi:methylated-DNA-[protein]-cysteine S-methyltransferase